MSIKRLQTLLKLLEKYSHLSLENIRIKKTDNYNYVEIVILKNKCFIEGYCYKYNNSTDKYILVNSYF